MDDLDSFDHYPHGHNYSYSLPVSHDGALPQQIVTPPTRVDSGLRDHSVYASPLAQDVWSFDQDVDASLNGQGTIDPALLQYNPQIPPRIPLASAPSSAVTSLSAWAGTDATSPPTSPEYLGNNVEDDSCALSEAELSELARLINDGALPDNDSEANLEGLFTPNEAQLVGHEQALPQHPGAVMANAHGHEPGIQTMIVVDTPPPPGTSRPPRKQSTDKKYPCPVEGCNRSEDQVTCSAASLTSLSQKWHAALTSRSTLQRCTSSSDHSFAPYPAARKPSMERDTAARGIGTITSG